VSSAKSVSSRLPALAAVYFLLILTAARRFCYFFPNYINSEAKSVLIVEIINFFQDFRLYIYAKMVLKRICFNNVYNYLMELSKKTVF